jgi:hypothetical protein
MRGAACCEPQKKCQAKSEIILVRSTENPKSEMKSNKSNNNNIFLPQTTVMIQEAREAAKQTRIFTRPSLS